MSTTLAIPLPALDELHSPSRSAGVHLEQAAVERHAPETVVIPTDNPQIRIGPITGDFTIALAHPAGHGRIEAWMRSFCEHENLRVILETPAGVREWDLGPTIRRNTGGALIPDSETEEHIDIAGTTYRVFVRSVTGGESLFDLRPVAKKKGLANLFSDSKEQQVLDSLSIQIQVVAAKENKDTGEREETKVRSFHDHWRQVRPSSEQPGRLFEQVEERQRRMRLGEVY